jgi:hypothetical protein
VGVKQNVHSTGGHLSARPTVHSPGPTMLRYSVRLPAQRPKPPESRRVTEWPRGARPLRKQRNRSCEMRVRIGHQLTANCVPNPRSSGRKIQLLNNQPLLSHRTTRRLACVNYSGAIITPCTALNIAAFSPMPSWTVMRPTDAETGDLRSCRNAWRRSCQKHSNRTDPRASCACSFIRVALPKLHRAA